MRRDSVHSVKPNVRRVRAGEWMLLRELRLRALADAPMAFGSTLMETRLLPDDVWRERAADAETGGARVTFIAEAGDRWLGMATGLSEPAFPAVATLVGMFVDQSARGLGVGRELVEAVAGWATARGVSQLHLWVTDGNESAIRLYLRSDFRFTGATEPLGHTPSVMERAMVRLLTSGSQSKDG